MVIYTAYRSNIIFLINLLEFIAAEITIYLTIVDTTTPHNLLAYIYSSSSLGWLYKVSFTINQPTHEKVARWLAKFMVENDTALYSQQIRGIHNIIANSLSRNGNILTTQLITMLYFVSSNQTPRNFKFMTLSAEIISWLHSLSQSLTKNQELLPRLPGSKLDALTNGDKSWTTWESKMISLQNIVDQNAHTSC